MNSRFERWTFCIHNAEICIYYLYNTTKCRSIWHKHSSVYTVGWRDNNTLTEPFLFTYKHMNTDWEHIERKCMKMKCDEIGFSFFYFISRMTIWIWPDFQGYSELWEYIVTESFYYCVYNVSLKPKSLVNYSWRLNEIVFRPLCDEFEYISREWWTKTDWIEIDMKESQRLGLLNNNNWAKEKKMRIHNRQKICWLLCTFVDISTNQHGIPLLY